MTRSFFQMSDFDLIKFNDIQTMRAYTFIHNVLIKNLNNIKFLILPSVFLANLYIFPL